VPVDPEADLRELPDPVGLLAQDRLRLGVEHGAVEVEVDHRRNFGLEAAVQRDRDFGIAPHDERVVHGRVAEGPFVDLGPGFLIEPGAGHESQRRRGRKKRLDTRAHVSHSIT
jgi:hypothetical protein